MLRLASAMRSRTGRTSRTSRNKNKNATRASKKKSKTPSGAPPYGSFLVVTLPPYIPTTKKNNNINERMFKNALNNLRKLDLK